MQHWKEGGHDKLCKKIKRGGGAEAYYLDQRYTEDAAASVTECAVDTKGQTCYICMEGIERRHTKNEGLVRMCACRGTAGFVHLSCLVRQAQSAKDDELSNEDISSKFSRWYDCRLWHQHFHGSVVVALGWACWKAYAGPWEGISYEEFIAKRNAFNQLATSLARAGRSAEALSLFEEFLVVTRRAVESDFLPELAVIDCETNMGSCLHELGRSDEALALRKKVYSRTVTLLGTKHPNTLMDANNLAGSLIASKDHIAEGVRFCREQVPLAESVLGPADETTLMLRWKLGRAIVLNNGAVTGADYDVLLADYEVILEAETILKDTVARARQVLGERYPLTMRIDAELGRVRYVLAQAQRR